MIARWLLALLLLAPLWGATPPSPPLTLVTEDLPPLNYPDGDKISGIATEIVMATLDRAGLNAIPRVYPWARAIGMAEQQENVLIFSIARIPERKIDFSGLAPCSPLANHSTSSRPAKIFS